MPLGGADAAAYVREAKRRRVMKAVIIRGYGGPEVLEIVDVPAPKAKAGEVIVKVAATSVNPVDWLVRDGGAKNFVKVKFPVILGCDLAGQVVELGPGVTRVAVGDEVFAMMPQDWGAHAELVALPEHLVVKKPAALSTIEAAALPVVALTALNGLKKQGGVARDERVLVNGASGGVGLSAVQIAKAHGASVTAVCAPWAFEIVKTHGADAVIDYQKEDFTTKSEQYDVIFDCVGNKPYRACTRVLRGRRVHLTTQPGVSTFVRQGLNPIFGVKVFGLLTKGNGDDLELVKSLVERGALKPIVDKVYPLAQVAEAQEYSKAGRARGKLVLTMDPQAA
jgi:NADPH:quinone reductase-like Zn-dependent oxidoreductase